MSEWIVVVAALLIYGVLWRMASPDTGLGLLLLEPAWLAERPGGRH